MHRLLFLVLFKLGHLSQEFLSDRSSLTVLRQIWPSHLFPSSGALILHLEDYFAFGLRWSMLWFLRWFDLRIHPCRWLGPLACSTWLFTGGSQSQRMQTCDPFLILLHRCGGTPLLRQLTRRLGALRRD